MAKPRADLPRAQEWMLTVRAAEAAALGLLTVAAFEIWTAYRSAHENFGSPDPDRQGELSWTQMAITMIVFTVRGPVGIFCALLCLLGCVAALRLAAPVANARILRWEVLALGVLAALASLAYVVATVVSFFFSDVTFGPMPDLRLQILASAGWLLALVPLVAVLGLWWWPLRTADELEPGLDQAAVGADGPAETYEVAVPQDARRVDEAGFDNAELIEPADAQSLESRRPGSDGSTTNGYDDFFRRA